MSKTERKCHRNKDSDLDKAKYYRRIRFSWHVPVKAKCWVTKEETAHSTTWE